MSSKSAHELLLELSRALNPLWSKAHFREEDLTKLLSLFDLSKESIWKKGSNASERIDFLATIETTHAHPGIAANRGILKEHVNKKLSNEKWRNTIMSQKVYNPDPDPDTIEKFNSKSFFVRAGKAVVQVNRNELFTRLLQMNNPLEPIQSMRILYDEKPRTFNLSEEELNNLCILFDIGTKQAPRFGDWPLQEDIWKEGSTDKSRVRFLLEQSPKSTWSPTANIRGALQQYLREIYPDCVRKKLHK